MANIQKWTKQNYIGLLRNDRQSFGHDEQQKCYHPEREKENFIWTDVESKNGKIQYSTVGNLNWQDKKISSYIEEKMKNRLATVNVLNRANVIHAVSLIFTVPQDVRREDQLKCLKQAVYFVRKKFGTENFLCATFHFHEHTPHVHVDFMPIVKKNGQEKLSAKEVINRRFLQTLHGDLGVEVDKALGYHVSVETGKTKKDGRSINWMKERQHKQELRELKKKIKELENEKNYYRMQLSIERGKLNFLREDSPSVFNRVSRGTRSIDRRPAVADLESEYEHWIDGKRRAGRAKKNRQIEKDNENERR